MENTLSLTQPCKIRISAFISQVFFHNQWLNKELTTFTCIQSLFFFIIGLSPYEWRAHYSKKTYYSCLVQRSFVHFAWMQDSLQKLTLQPFSNFTSGMAGMRKCLNIYKIKWLLTRMQNKEQGFEKRSDRIPIMVACVCYIFIFSLETLSGKNIH